MPNEKISSCAFFTRTSSRVAFIGTYIRIGDCKTLNQRSRNFSGVGGDIPANRGSYSSLLVPIWSNLDLRAVARTQKVVEHSGNFDPSDFWGLFFERLTGFGAGRRTGNFADMFHVEAVKNLLGVSNRKLVLSETLGLLCLTVWVGVVASLTLPRKKKSFIFESI